MTRLKNKRKLKVKYADISDTRVLLNQIAFTLFLWVTGVTLITLAIRFIYEGYILTPTDYRTDSDIYFFSTNPLSYVFNLLFYLGGGAYCLAAPYLFRKHFPRKKDQKSNHRNTK